MAEQKTNREGRGTFAQLYDVQEELSRRSTKPLGRPPKKVQRKPTTIHLTQAENRNLGKLHLQVSEQVSINRSELTGVAIDLLAALVEKNWPQIKSRTVAADDVEAFRKAVLDFVNS